MASTTNRPAFSYVEEIQQSTKLAAEELEMVKERECQLQAQKEALLLMRRNYDADIGERQRVINAAREKLPDIQAKKMFDDVFGLVDSCYHEELLILELKEQLVLAKALREEKDCSDMLQGLIEVQDIPDDVDPSSVLCSWYYQMKKHIRSNLNCPADEDCFYNIKLSSSVHRGSVSGSFSVPTLTFSTRYRGYCLYLSIEETRSSSQCPSIPQYAITSDIQLEGLEVKGCEYLERGQTVEEFIMQVVWPLMEKNICA